MALRQPVPKLSYNLEEALAATGVGRNTLLAAIDRGELAVRRIGPDGPGRRILIHGPSLEAWVRPEDPDKSAAPRGEPN